MAYALHNLLYKRCSATFKAEGGQPDEPATGQPGQWSAHWSARSDCVTEPIKGHELLAYIRNVSFQTDTKSQRMRQHERFDYVNIGQWVDERLSLNIEKIRWYYEYNRKHKGSPVNQDGGNGSSPRTYHKQPASVCSVPCPPGQYRQYHEGQTCCWHCSPGRDHEIIYNDTHCVPCGQGFVPDNAMAVCIKLPIEHMRWSSPWTMVPAAFTGFGIVATLFTSVIFVRYNKTPIIMASGRELCYILLFGILVCYFISLVILAKPSHVTCTVIRVGLNLGLSICYSAILTKTNRISRIFNRGLTAGLKRPSYTSPKSQAFICFCLVSIQLVFIIAWLVKEPPSIREVIYRTGHGNVAVLQCGISAATTVISLIYNMTLIVLCTTYAFKTRKIPENFNEAKYIGFTMYSTCIVWLAFIPIYFGTNNDFKIQVASLAMCISISATVSLGCLFTPKVYICIFQPYKNTRSSVPGHGGISGLPGTFGSNSASSALRFTKPSVTVSKPQVPMSSVTNSSDSPVNRGTVASAGPAICVIAEPSSGTVRTSTTNDCDTTYISPSPDEDEIFRRRMPSSFDSDHGQDHPKTVKFEVNDNEHDDIVENVDVSSDENVNTYL
ncbi:Metabotropic glutamate receptor 3 [Halotydeus destructor]|nr:Metabotropic glutamate receptor 3 [Halotydeus destructor]